MHVLSYVFCYRNISNLNAAVSVVLSGYCLWFDNDLYDDKVWYDSSIARLACALVIGYMMADLVCMLLWCKLSSGTVFGYMFHHAATIYAYYFISAYGVLCYFGMLRLIAEASTPAVNKRWFFDTLKYPRTRIPVILNGFLMILTFFIFRMVTMPIYWYQIWLVSGTEEVIELGHIQLIMYIPCFVLDVLNIFWFYKMCKGFMKALKGLFSQSANTNESRKHV
ncbi:TLC domain [Mactra antiquata]